MTLNTRGHSTNQVIVSSIGIVLISYREHCGSPGSDHNLKTQGEDRQGGGGFKCIGALVMK